MGAPIQDVKLHANWSLTSNTFEDYYYRPAEQHQRGQKLVQRIFGDYTEKKTKSRVGVEPTPIVGRSYDNNNVSETETKDVVATRPWYRRWL
ncbi:hypothetical protein G6F61_012288 [Rhizopus arrhizus]|nr:hypothetical protein G6F61_012288 [Rhizopus arrhizus]